MRRRRRGTDGGDARDAPALADGPMTPLGPSPPTPFRDNRILHHGQHVAIVVAHTREQAAAAALLVRSNTSRAPRYRDRESRRGGPAKPVGTGAAPRRCRSGARVRRGALRRDVRYRGRDQQSDGAVRDRGALGEEPPDRARLHPVARHGEGGPWRPCSICRRATYGCSYPIWEAGSALGSELGRTSSWPRSPRGL